MIKKDNVQRSFSVKKLVSSKDILKRYAFWSVQGFKRLLFWSVQRPKRLFVLNFSSSDALLGRPELGYGKQFGRKRFYEVYRGSCRQQQCIYIDREYKLHENTQPYPNVSLATRKYVTPVQDIRNMSISWTIPDYREHTEANPVQYISHLVGHEGPGSLLWMVQFVVCRWETWGACFSIF